MLSILSRLPALGGSSVRTLDVVEGRVWCPRRDADVDVDRCVGCAGANAMVVRNGAMTVNCSARRTALSIVVPQ